MLKFHLDWDLFNPLPAKRTLIVAPKCINLSLYSCHNCMQGSAGNLVDGSLEERIGNGKFLLISLILILNLEFLHIGKTNWPL